VTMLRSSGFSLSLEDTREQRWSVVVLHLGQNLFAEYFAVLPGAKDMGQHDIVIGDILETMEKVCLILTDS